MSYADPKHMPHTPHHPVKRKPYKLEAVTTCVNNADFLAHTLPLNLRHFDRIVVVTSPADEATQRVCEYHRVECKVTDAFRSQWKNTFHKGAGMNEGWAMLDCDAWMLHYDADIVLPPHTRVALERADLDTTMVYGIDRAEFKSYEDWARFHGDPEPQEQGGFLIHTENHGMHLGTRVEFPHAGGWIPIGFFTLWHADSGITRYVEGHSDAGREDCQFSLQWPRAKRSLIPEIIAYHLESERGELGVNWKGRTTKRFGVTR